MGVYLVNAFSIGMLSEFPITVKVEEIDINEAKQILANSFVSAIGHQSTSLILSKMLGLPVETNRVAIKLQRGDVLVVFQLLQRLEEGAVLSEQEILNIPHKFFKITLQ
jgi:RNase P/RNase MRP subunit POP5